MNVLAFGHENGDIVRILPQLWSFCPVFGFCWFLVTWFWPFLPFGQSFRPFTGRQRVHLVQGARGCDAFAGPEPDGAGVAGHGQRGELRDKGEQYLENNHPKSQVDIDGSGTIDFAEFCQMMKRMNKVGLRRDKHCSNPWNCPGLSGNFRGLTSFPLH